MSSYLSKGNSTLRPLEGALGEHIQRSAILVLVPNFSPPSLLTLPPLHHVHLKVDSEARPMMRIQSEGLEPVFSISVICWLSVVRFPLLLRVIRLKPLPFWQ